jgi:hypothetical protein
MGDVGTVFADLREALLAQRDVIAERLAAVEAAEAALARMADVFGLPANGSLGPLEPDVTLPGTTPRHPSTHRLLARLRRARNRQFARSARIHSRRRSAAASRSGIARRVADRAPACGAAA